MSVSWGSRLKEKSEGNSRVLRFVQVHLHALLDLVQTGEMTQSQARMFTGRCVLKELSLAGHGSGKYPAVWCICNSLLFAIPPTKSWPLKEMMDELCYCSFSSLSSPSFFFRSIEDGNSVHLRLRRRILTLFARRFKTRSTSDAGFGQSPLALCAAVRVRSFDLWFADDTSSTWLVAVRWFGKPKSCDWNFTYRRSGEKPAGLVHSYVSGNASIFCLLSQILQELTSYAAFLLMSSVWGKLLFNPPPCEAS